MNAENRKAHCVDAHWTGYARCSDCGVRESVLFADLGKEDLERILRPIEQYEYEPQAVLYREGETGPALFTIRSGLVKLVKVLLNGTQRVVRLLHRGDVAGIELLVDRTYHHTAVAITPVDVCRIETEVIRGIGVCNPKIHEQLIKRWQRNVDEADAFIVDLSTGNASARLARLLIKLSSALDNGEGCVVPQREDIGAIIGTSTETASRIIAQFKRSGLIKETHRECLQCDRAGLEEIARDDD